MRRDGKTDGREGEGNGSEKEDVSEMMHSRGKTTRHGEGKLQHTETR